MTLQGIDAIAERIDEARQSDERRRDLDKLPWLLSDEACDYLRFRGKHRLRSLYRFIREKGIATARRSERRLLISTADLRKAIGARHGR